MILYFDRGSLVLVPKARGEEQLHFLGSGVTVCLPDPLPYLLDVESELVQNLALLHGPVTRRVGTEGEGIVFLAQDRVFSDLTAAADASDNGLVKVRKLEN